MRRHAALLVLFFAAVAHAQTIHVSAAISLKDAFGKITSAFHDQTHVDVELSFGASGQMLAQIRQGAPADLFVSAAEEQVEAAIKDGLAVADTRQVIAGNELLLVVPADSALKLRGFDDLADTRVRKIAVGEPRTVPAGKYAREVIQHLKLQDAVRERLVYGENVRQVLAYVERGEVDAGLVYASDARVSGDKIKVITSAPAGSHAPILYPAVVLKAAQQPKEAGAFLEYLQSPAAQRVLADYGFLPPPADAGNGGAKTSP